MGCAERRVGWSRDLRCCDIQKPATIFLPALAARYLLSRARTIHARFVSIEAYTLRRRLSGQHSRRSASPRIPGATGSSRYWSWWYSQLLAISQTLTQALTLSSLVFTLLHLRTTGKHANGHKTKYYTFSSSDFLINQLIMRVMFKLICFYTQELF